MSRELRFRAWDKVSKIFLDMSDACYYLLPHGKLVQITCNERKPDTHIELDAVVQLYTQLKDCKGKEIYEGDIVEFTYNGLFLKGEVVFGNGGWELKGVDYGEHFRLIEIVHLCEVVGNIHQNNEVFTSKK